MGNVTLKEAKEALEDLGMWMDSRYNSRFVGTPIQTWDMPRKEKGFFTVYAMNLVLESDGFDCLGRQKPEDLTAFTTMLRRLGAKKTAAFVRHTLATMGGKNARDKNKSTDEYYRLFKRDKVWLKLLDYVGRRIYVRYFLRLQAIHEAGGNMFNPKEWQGELPEA